MSKKYQNSQHNKITNITSNYNNPPTLKKTYKAKRASHKAINKIQTYSQKVK
jgi:hypothetical protein